MAAPTSHDLRLSLFGPVFNEREALMLNCLALVVFGVVELLMMLFADVSLLTGRAVSSVNFYYT